MPRPIGIIAGQGSLPMLTAAGIRASGRQVVCVGLRDQFDAALPEQCDQFATASIIQLGRWVRLLRRWGASEAVMVGRVKKNRMYDPLRLFRHMPDWRAAKIWYGTLRHDKRTDHMLRAVADELASCGIQLIDSTQYIPDHIAPAGVLTRHKPSAQQQADIAFGLPIVHRLGELDIGQCIAVKEHEVIAVEAMEGTDALIRRAGELCRSGNWTLIKAAKPQQDLRFDVPTVGQQTIELLRQCGGRCLAVEAGRVILLDRPQLLAAADKAGVTVMGVSLG